jgi:hypothetical protein
MNQFHEDHDDEEGEVKTEDRVRGWWMLLPVVAVGVLIYQIGTGAMTSVFDENE